MKPKLSPQRALIALRSFPSVRQAARSCGVKPETLLRLTLDDDELAAAYQECVHGVIRQRQAEERAVERRRRKAERPESMRAIERRQARFFAASGRDPRQAAAALHKRLNHERRQEKAATIEEAIDAIDAIIAEKKPVVSQKALDVFDRWCANCKSHRVDDPCEVCNRHTLLVKGEG